MSTLPHPILVRVETSFTRTSTGWVTAQALPQLGRYGKLLRLILREDPTDNAGTAGVAYLAANISALSTAGRLVIIGLQGGLKAELDIGALLTKRAAVMATSLRARPSAEKAAIVSAMVAQVWPLIADGTVRPIIHATYPLEDVRTAHQVLEDSSHTGKVLLTI